MTVFYDCFYIYVLYFISFRYLCRPPRPSCFKFWDRVSTLIILLLLFFTVARLPNKVNEILRIMHQQIYLLQGHWIILIYCIPTSRVADHLLVGAQKLPFVFAVCLYLGIISQNRCEKQTKSHC